MKDKSIIAVMIFSVALIAMFFIVLLSNGATVTKVTNEISTSQETTENIIVESETTESNDSGKDVSYQEIDAAVNIKVSDMREEVLREIVDYDAFIYSIKECFYKMGIMETDIICRNKITFDYNDNLIYFSMYVKNQTLKYFEVVYDLTTFSYFISAD